MDGMGGGDTSSPPLEEELSYDVINQGFTDGEADVDEPRTENKPRNSLNVLLMEDNLTARQKKRMEIMFAGIDEEIQKELFSEPLNIRRIKAISVTFYKAWLFLKILLS